MGRLDLIILAAAAAAAAQTYTGAATLIHHASISNEVRGSSRCRKPAVNHTYPGPALQPSPSNWTMRAALWQSQRRSRQLSPGDDFAVWAKAAAPLFTLASQTENR